MATKKKLKVSPKVESKDASLSLKTCRLLISEQAQALSKLASGINEDFLHTVKLILELPPKGRVVVSGVGKASFIAMKTSATLASVGVPSFFLHPAEAIHGDLGRYSEGDVALIYSKSGETPEVLRVLPAIKRFGCPVIAVTSNKRSSLGRHADLVVEIGEIKEVGMHGLAPTTSTLCMLAVGDAIAMAVLEERGISKERFAEFHPGGALGHTLRTVKEVMRTGDSLCIVYDDTAAKEVLKRITKTRGRPGAAAVVNRQNKLVGIFTDGDLRRCLESDAEFLRKPINKIMGRSPKTIAPDQLVEEALHLMSLHKIDQLLVTDHKSTPVGLIDIQDVVEVK